MMSYTVMGDTVNLASRLEGVNKAYGTRMLVSNATAHAAGDALEMREIDRVVVLGKTEPEAVYEVMARAGELTPVQAALRSRYAEGLAAYRAKLWEAAQRAFQAALEIVPDDGPSLALLKRLDTLQAAELADNWDGAWHLDHK
jgi:adenylate cyclase